jgi:hypothetical protein
MSYLVQCVEVAVRENMDMGRQHVVGARGDLQQKIIRSGSPKPIGLHITPVVSVQPRLLRQAAHNVWIESCERYYERLEPREI